MDFIINHSSLFISIGVIALIALIGYYADKKDSKKNNTSKPVTKGSDVESSVSSQSENNNAPEVLDDKPEVLNFDVPETVSEPSVPETIDIPANDAVETPVAAAPEFTSDLSDFLINPDDPNVYSANNNVQMAPGPYAAPVSPIGVVPGTPVINPAPVNSVPVVNSAPESVGPVQGSAVSSVVEPVSIPEQPVATLVETPVYETPVVDEIPVPETEPAVTSSEFFANETSDLANVGRTCQHDERSLAQEASLARRSQTGGNARAQGGKVASEVVREVARQLVLAEVERVFQPH